MKGKASACRLPSFAALIGSHRMSPHPDQWLLAHCLPGWRPSPLVRAAMTKDDAFLPKMFWSTEAPEIEDVVEQKPVYNLSWLNVKEKKMLVCFFGKFKMGHGSYFCHSHNFNFGHRCISVLYTVLFWFSALNRIDFLSNALNEPAISDWFFLLFLRDDNFGPRTLCFSWDARVCYCAFDELSLKLFSLLQIA